MSQLFVDSIQPKTSGGVISGVGKILQVKSSAFTNVQAISSADRTVIVSSYHGSSRYSSSHMAISNLR